MPPPCLSTHMRQCIVDLPWALLRSTPRAVLLSHTRAYASQSKSPRPSHFAGKTISLDHFLQRSRAIALYRTIVRGCRKISDPNSRREMLDMARVEFRRNKDVTDLTQIRYLISTGKTQWESMERYIDGL